MPGHRRIRSLTLKELDLHCETAPGPFKSLLPFRANICCAWSPNSVHAELELQSVISLSATYTQSYLPTSIFFYDLIQKIPTWVKVLVCIVETSVCKTILSIKGFGPVINPIRNLHKERKGTIPTLH